MSSIFLFAWDLYAAAGGKFLLYVLCGLGSQG